MKKILSTLSILVALSVNAQNPLSQANCDLTLNVQGVGGTNGVSVTYNPKSQVYYAAFAGNSSYPLEAFSADGKPISTQECGYDLRGIWYNPKSKSLHGIAYDNQGSFEMKVNSDGSIKGAVFSSFSYGMDAQTVGTYAAKKKSVMFVEGRTVYFFKSKKTSPKKVELLPNNSNVELNTNGPMYTGVKNYEIALFEAQSMTVHLFSASSGKETAKVVLKNGVCGDIFNIPSYFRVSYANGRVFLFDTEARSWKGFPIFD